MTSAPAGSCWNPLSSRFVFATGIECSYPTVSDVAGRRVRVDQLEQTFHYRFWQQDLALVRELGLRWLRYGPPYYRVHMGPDQYDWEFTDLVFAEMRRLGIAPIADLCHFGVPDWIGDFQNPEWPELFAAYVCAKLSTLAGFWNERARGSSCLRHRPQAPLPGQPPRHPCDPRGAPGRRLHPERERRVFPPRRHRPGDGRAGGVGESGALPLVRSALLRAAAGRHPPLPVRQRA